MAPSPNSPLSNQVVESLQNLSINSPVKTLEGSDPVTEATAKPYETLATAIQPFSNFHMPTSYHNEGYGGQSWKERIHSRHSSHETADMLHSAHLMYQHGYHYVPYMIYTPPAPPASSVGNEVQHYQYPTQYYNPNDQPRIKSNSDNEVNIAPLLYGTNSGFYSTVPLTNFPPQGNTHNLQPLPNILQTRSSSTLNAAPGTMGHTYPTNRTSSQHVDTLATEFRSYNYKAKTVGAGWLAADVKKGQDYGRGASSNANRTADILNELRIGPRTNREYPKVGEITGETKGQSLLGRNNVENLSPELLNKKKFDGENFPEEYSCAKFFVIKSYSEDDVHKSMKYGFWASTPSGNKKLDAGFQDAKQNLGGCPVFLFFSVNASGQFVGLAEMVGPVDFNKTLEYWQQDKWQGCFAVKWHIIKDVHNRSLRHIKLKSNENRSVTNSRDTQEVEFGQGMEMLKIFKSNPLTTSVLDDLGFYDNREKQIQEERAKQKKDKRPMPGVESSDSATTTVEKAIVDTKELQAERGRLPMLYDEVLAKDSNFEGVS